MPVSALSSYPIARDFRFILCPLYILYPLYTVSAREIPLFNKNKKYNSTHDIIDSQRLSDAYGANTLHDVNQLFHLQTFRAVVDGNEGATSSVPVAVSRIISVCLNIKLTLVV